MGEAGFPRREFLYDIQFWEASRIIRGNANRNAATWSAIRWMTYNIMRIMPYFDADKSGIRKPTDLLRFPWDAKETDDENIPTEEEVERMRELIRKENEKNGMN